MSRPFQRSRGLRGKQLEPRIDQHMLGSSLADFVLVPLLVRRVGQVLVCVGTPIELEFRAELCDGREDPDGRATLRGPGAPLLDAPGLLSALLLCGCGTHVGGRNGPNPEQRPPLLAAPPPPRSAVIEAVDVLRAVTDTNAFGSKVEEKGWQGEGEGGGL